MTGTSTREKSFLKHQIPSKTCPPTHPHTHTHALRDL